MADSPERRAQKRACEDRARVQCACGALCAAGSKWTGAKRCARCENQWRRDQRDLRFIKIEALWHEGLSRRAIAPLVGTTVGALSVSMSRMRDEGWDLPYRHKGEWKDRSGTNDVGGVWSWWS